ncbi:Alpha-glucosidase [Dactylella cylindrospora]|nr:Alpha-glucosidase [Dactylella cylindrospora]
MAQILESISTKVQSIISDPPLPKLGDDTIGESTKRGDNETVPEYYSIVGQAEWSGQSSCTAYLQGKAGQATKYGPLVDRLKLEIVPFTSKIARIKITDADKKRWEIPQELVPIGEDLPDAEKFPSDANFVIDLSNKSGASGFAIVRKSDGVPVFDCRGLPFSFCDQYLEISTKLPEGELGEETFVYGLGEVTGPFLRQPGTRFAFWARDAQTPLHENAYSSFPMFAGMHKGKAFGVYLHNCNALDMIYTPGKITYKVVGGVLDFFVFTGDTYEDVTRQYQQVSGFPQLPPYYSLGYHQCRWFYDTTEKLHEAREKNMEAEIPVDVFWLDIDYMIKYKLFTLDETRYPKFASYVRDVMHKDNHKLVAILDPGIKCNVEGYKPWTRGVELDLFIKNGNSRRDFVGKVWPGHVVFPDWMHPSVQNYWTEMIRGWLEILPVDGIWHGFIKRNLMRSDFGTRYTDAIYAFLGSNFINGDVWEAGGDAEEDEILIPTDEETVAEMAKAAAEGIEIGGDDGKRGAAKPKPLLAFDPSKPFSITNPPYAVNHGNEDWPLSARSISVESTHHGGVTEYDVHNLFGHLNCKVTYNSMLEIRPDERPFILTRAAFAGTGKYSSKW